MRRAVLVPAQRPGSGSCAHALCRAMAPHHVMHEDTVRGSGGHLGRVTDPALGVAEARPLGRAREVVMRRAVDRQLAPLLHARAGAMRAAPTTSEALLWEALRGGRLGVGFRRQVPIGRYIVDFCAPAARLVVEVDGGYHAHRERADARRDRALARLGYTVVRVPAELVVHRRAEAIVLVAAALAGR